VGPSEYVQWDLVRGPFRIFTMGRRSWDF
jgi:hypothetical protein